ncbi:hypothetical protein SS21_11240, partial [Enterobacter roggenkampii]
PPTVRLSGSAVMLVPRRSSQPPTVRLSGSAVMLVPRRSSQPPTVRLSGKASTPLTSSRSRLWVTVIFPLSETVC